MTLREWGLLAVLCGAQVLEVLGVTVVIVALPVIGTELALSAGRLQLVVSLYAVVYGGLLLTSGRVADVLGRRSVLAVGLLVTATGAVAAALAPSGPVLLLGRAVQGLGGALVTPCALALLTAAFADGRPRRLAVSAWTAAAAGGGALGFGAGGVLVAGVGWRAVFWLLGGVAVVLFALLWAAVPAPVRPGRRRGVDLPGTATAVTGLVLLVVGVGEVADPGPGGVVVTGAGVVFLVGFAVTQRLGRDPLLGWATLTDRRFLLANGVAFTNTATTAASGTLVSLVAADLLGLGPAATGLALLPFSVMVVVGSLFGGFWLRRARHRGMAVGLAVVAASLAGMAGATAARSVPLLVVAVAVAGIGLSWAAVTSTDAATAALPATRQGTAAGAVSTAAQVGTALGVAGLLALAAGVDGHAGPVGSGYVVAFLAAALAAGGVALGVLLGGRAVLGDGAR